jgi:hypothetical protein
MRTRVLALAVLPALLLLSVSGAPAPPPPYGTVTGRVVLAGAVPLRRIIHKKGAAVRDAACCAREDLYSDELVIDPKTKGIANVCVFLPKAKAIHPKLQKVTPKEVRLEQKGCRFVPHVLFVRVGQTVRVRSLDKCAHTLRAYALGWSGVNVLLLPSRELKVAVPAPGGKVPIVWADCNIHPWMRSWWLVLDHPYGALTDPAGRFALRDLPAGAHTLRVWHEKSGWIDKALKVRVRRGQTTDLGVVRVPLARFADR